MPLPELKAMPLLELKPLPLPELVAMPPRKFEAMLFPLVSLAGQFPELEQPLAPPPLPLFAVTWSVTTILSISIWTILIFL